MPILHDHNGKDLDIESNSFQGQGMGSSMSIVKMSYQCQCGKIIKIEDRVIIDGFIALQVAVGDHEDDACG